MIVMIMGFPASGKGTVAKKYLDQGYLHLNRDKHGGKVIDLLPKMEAALNNNRDVVLDNTFPTAASRKPFIDLAKKKNVPIKCVFLCTNADQSQINALHRMWKRHGKIFFDNKDLEEVKDDPNMFPPVVLFKYRKELEIPFIAEGFSSLAKVKFERYYSKNYKNSAVIFDYDDTLRTVKNGNYKFPTQQSEVSLLPNRKEVVQKLKGKGKLLLGVSNQSAIGKGIITEYDARICFECTNKMLGVGIEYVYCPHNIGGSGVSCF